MPMPFQPFKGAEPIAGYQLVDRLGSGGYGSVWKTTAPGGMMKAIKIVHGDLDGHQAEQELKALNRIKEVRHPFLLSLERFEIIDGQLFIVSELADKSLADRFQECRQGGLPGIPRDELLDYLRDAADALDYIREIHDLQHLDIKPQNVLLLGGRIKIADFGLVKDLVGNSVTATGGGTPLYATPEAFDGRVSRYSDQYSLAVVYQEMLTGERPYPGTTLLQLAAQHMSSRPFLDPLPPQDRPTIARALARVPEQRFPSCRVMVDRLLWGPRGPTTAARQETPSSLEDLRSHPETLLPPGHDAADLEKVDTPDVRLDAPTRPTPPPEWRSRAAARACVETPEAPAVSAAELRPTLFLGLGGLAGATLRRLKQRLRESAGTLSAVPVWQLLLVDTDRSSLRAAQQAGPGEPLELHETLLAPLRSPEHYRDQSRTLLRWLERRWLYGIPRSLQTEGLRPLGHLALVDNSAAITSRLRHALTQLSGQEARTTLLQATGKDLRQHQPRIFLIASIAGATGGGMLLGTAYALRQVLAELGLSAEGLCGLLLHATSSRPADRELACANACATLRELSHFSRAGASYPGNPDNGLAALGAGQAPFEDCYLVHLGDNLDKPEAETATGMLAEYLHLDAATLGGKAFDQFREKTRSGPEDANNGLQLRSFGLSRIGFPRRRLTELAGNLLCRQLVERWPGCLLGPDRENMEKEAERWALELGLEPKALDRRFYDAAEVVLGESPDSYFLKILDQGLGAPSGPPGKKAIRRVLNRIDDLLGAGPAADDKTPPHVLPFETVLHGQAKRLGTQTAESLLDRLRSLVEDPARRLQAADIAAHWLVQHLRGTSEGLRSELKELRGAREQLRSRLLEGETNGKSSSLRWLARRNESKATEKTNSRLLDYCELRLLEIVAQSTLTVFGAVEQQLSLFIQDLALGRQQLTAFAERFEPAPADPQTTDNPSSSISCLLPGPLTTVNETAAALHAKLAPNWLDAFTEEVQQEVLATRGGLWAVLLGKPQLAKAVRDDMLRRARSIFRDALAEQDAAQLFLKVHESPEAAAKALLTEVQAALPRLNVADAWHHLLVAVPRSPGGAALRDLTAQTLSGIPHTLLDSDDDVVLCLEAAHLPVAELAAALLGPTAGYAELAEQVRTRVDIPWSAF
jgi:serine/threonine protein kinase